MLRRALAWAVAAVLAAAAPARAAADGANPALQKLVQEAAFEGTLNVVWGDEFGAAKGAREIAAAINETYGITISIAYTPGPSMPQVGTRIVLEAQAGRPASSDLYVGAETNIPPLMLAHVIRPVPWSTYFPYITPEMQVSDHSAVLVSTLYNGIYYNAEDVKPSEVPKVMNDVFKPQWKGKIATTPYAVGFDRLALWKGTEAIRPIVEKTAQWAGGLLRCGDYERLATGEFILLFFDCGRTDEHLMRRNGGPLEQATLDDAAMTTTWYLAVPTNSAHPALATLVAGFLLSAPGQKLIESTSSPGSHLVPGTEAWKHWQDLQARGIKIDDAGPDELLPDTDKLKVIRDEFQRIVRN